MQRRGGFWPTLVSVLPDLALGRACDAALDQRRPVPLRYRRTAARIRRAARLSRRCATAPTSSGSLRALHDRCWLAGFGWLMVGAGGQLLERSIVDRMVGAPERLVFEGGPILDPPLGAGSREPPPGAGGRRRARYGHRLPAAQHRRDGEVARTQSQSRRIARAWIGKGARAHSSRAQAQAPRRSAPACRSRPPRRRSRASATGSCCPMSRCRSMTRSLPAARSPTCWPIPERFEGATLADPLEGVDYGTCKARDHAPSRRHAVDQFVRPRPHRL